MLQTARFYARLYYHAQTRAHNLLRQKVITYWVSAIVGYILTIFFLINIIFEKRQTILSIEFKVQNMIDILSLFAILSYDQFMRFLTLIR